MSVPTNRDEAREAGATAWRAGGVPLHDIGGHMAEIGIPLELRGSWMAGLEDAMEDDGIDTDPDSDGHGWERAALARIA